MPPFNRLDKVGVILYRAGDGIMYHRFCFLAGALCQPVEPGLFFECKVHFHICDSRPAAPLCQ
jgi:hypothetical protein